jgi:hypothetical protein
MTGKALSRYLHGMLQPGEQVLLETLARMDTKTGWIGLTDTRLLFLHGGILGVKTIEIPLSSTRSVSFDSGAIWNHLSLLADGIGRIQFTSIDRATLKHISEMLERFSGAGQARKTSGSSQRSVSSMPVPNPAATPPKKPSGCLLTILVVVGALFFLSMIGSLINSVDNKATQTTPNTSSPHHSKDGMVDFIEVPREVAGPVRQPAAVPKGDAAVIDSKAMEGLHYRTLAPKITETRNFAFVELKSIVSGRMTEAGLRSLLHRLNAEVSQIEGLNQHEHPDSSQIALFTTEEDATSGSGHWIALLNWREGSPLDVRINEAMLKDVNSPSEVRMGLPDEMRREIFWEACLATNRAYAETDAIYPLKSEYGSDAERVAYIQKIARTFRDLESRYHADVAGKHGIPANQIEKIMEEGTEKSWSFPAPMQQQ